MTEEADGATMLWFYVPDFPAVRGKLQWAYDAYWVVEHAAEPGRVAGCPDDADVMVRGKPYDVAAFVDWLRTSGIAGLMIEGENVINDTKN